MIYNTCHLESENSQEKQWPLFHFDTLHKTVNKFKTHKHGTVNKFKTHKYETVKYFKVRKYGTVREAAMVIGQACGTWWGANYFLRQV